MNIAPKTLQQIDHNIYTFCKHDAFVSGASDYWDIYEGFAANITRTMPRDKDCHLYNFLLHYRFWGKDNYYRNSFWSDTPFDGLDVATQTLAETYIEDCSAALDDWDRIMPEEEQPLTLLELIKKGLNRASKNGTLWYMVTAGYKAKEAIAFAPKSSLQTEKVQLDKQLVIEFVESELAKGINEFSFSTCTSGDSNIISDLKEEEYNLIME